MGKQLKTKQAIAMDIWKSHPNYLGSSSVDLPLQELVDFLANLFCPGPYYYYVIDSPTLTFEMVSDSTQDILGIAPDQLTMEKLLELVHPDDMSFFYRCEDVVAHFLRNCITPDKVVKYKISYCLRIRTSPDTYKLFLLQTITMKTTEDGSLLKVFGSNTDISHITTENNYRMSLAGLYEEPSYMEIDVFAEDVFDKFVPYDYSKANNLFTRRELEIIKLLSLGLSTEELAAELSIAYQTVVTHRKNLMRKSGFKNTTELVAECIRKGVI